MILAIISRNSENFEGGRHIPLDPTLEYSPANTKIFLTISMKIDKNGGKMPETLHKIDLCAFSDFLHFYIKDRKILQITVLNETENKFENKIFQLRPCVAEKLASLKLINFSIESNPKSDDSFFSFFCAR